MSGNVGTGPGDITPDGCAVDFYALLPTFGEPEIVHAALPDGASILELGCGTGRVLRPLAQLGHPVLGVDESPAMLARIPDLPTVCSPIEMLRLGQKFDAVLLASTMINVPPPQRHAFLATCRNHLRPDGIAIFQQNPPAWFETFGQAPREREDPGGIRRLVRTARRDPPLIHIEVEYQVAGQVWTHAWASSEISDDELRMDLAAAGLLYGHALTEDTAWFTAHPAW